MTPWPSVVPLPEASQPASVAVGRKVPVMPILELMPTSEDAETTPAVRNAWLAAGASLIDFTKVPALTPADAGQ